MESLPDGLVEDLGTASGHPRDRSASEGVACIQTHISWVFLTRDRAYKLHKAVELPFVSFASRAARNADSLRECELNRRLAADVYLGLAPLLPAANGFEVGPVAYEPDPEVISQAPTEYCVVMRRLPDGRDGLSLLEVDELASEQLEATAEVLADFHARVSLGAPAPFARDVWFERVWSPISNAIDLADAQPAAHVDSRLLSRLRDAAQTRFDALGDTLDARRQAGRLVDGHGDLQLAHLWFEHETGAPQIIDCIAFREDFRQLDVASELAFLSMDLRYRGRSDLAEHFLNCYARAADDYPLYSVVDFFVAYRAIVRGAVAAVAVGDAAIGEEQRAKAAHSSSAHLELAEQSLAPTRSGALIAVCGTVGSGKSTAAGVLADALEGVVISSDRTRKHMAGLAPTERGREHPERAIYDGRVTDRVYAGLLERAATVVDSGRVAVLDATFARAQHRREALRWARDRRLPILLVETRCAEAEALDRLRRREREGADASDAGPAFYRESLRRYEEPAEWPADAKLSIRTDATNWRDTLRATAVQRVRLAVGTLEGS
jgi:hypothetical protein